MANEGAEATEFTLEKALILALVREPDMEWTPGSIHPILLGWQSYGEPCHIEIGFSTDSQTWIYWTRPNHLNRLSFSNLLSLLQDPSFRKKHGIERDDE